ncbi:MAG: hypothetical protein Q7T62_06305 [Undibacterium sp.]|nr:hypothetical protein [Undibacterium sp.]
MSDLKTEPFDKFPLPIVAKAFVSSCTYLSQEGGGLETNEVAQLRKEIAKAAGEHGGAFVSEAQRPELKAPHYSNLSIAKYLLQQVRSCEKFIFILFGEGQGHLLNLDGTQLTSTFFELELYQAAILGKPIYRLCSKAFRFAQQIQILRLLDFGFLGPTSQPDQLDDAEISSAVIAILLNESHAERWRVSSAEVRPDVLVERLMRSRDRKFGEQSKTPMHFLDLPNSGFDQYASPSIDMNSVLSLMTAQGRRMFDDHMDEKLAWAWLVMRELMVTPLLDFAGKIVVREPEILSAWNAALTTWHGAASWSGHHGHTRMGTMPTLVTLSEVRRAIREDRHLSVSGTDYFGASIVDPVGAFGSSYYSLAKMVSSPMRADVLSEVHSCLDQAVKLEPHAAAGILAVRASACLLEKRCTEAVELYERSFQVSLSQGQSKSDLGTIICELGFAQVQNREYRKGRRTLEEGIDLLRDQKMRGMLVNHGDMVRALVKAAFANVVTGHWWKGAQYLADAHTIADSKGLNAYAARREIRYVGRFVDQARKRFRRW